MGRALSSLTATTTTLVSACVVVVAVAIPGSAASIGGVAAASLFAQTGTGYPKSYAMSDNFVGNGGLNARIIASGQTWTTTSGTWSTVSSTVRTTSTANTQIAFLPWLDVPTAVTATLAVSGTYRAGVVMHQNAAGTVGTALVIRNDGSVVIARLASGSGFTAMASTTGAGSGTWTLEYSSGVYTAKKNAVSVLTYTVPVASRPTYEANTNVGLYARASNTNTFWSAFNVTSI